MKEKAITGIGFIALCAMFYCMGLCIESHCMACAALPLIGVIVSGAVGVYASNSVEYDDDTE